MTQVCHITTAHGNRDNRILLKECISLKESGEYAVFLVAPGEDEVYDGVQICGLGKKPKSRIKRMTEYVNKALKMALKLNAEIYHLHDPELLRIALKLKSRGKKVIFDSHELYAEQIKIKSYLPKIVATSLASLYSRYEKRIFKRIDGVIFPCTIKGINPFEGKCRNIETVNNTPRMEELYDKYDENAEKYPNSICYVGSLSYERGITHLVKAAYLANANLLLGGNIEQGYKEELMSMREFSNVTYLGELNREEVVDLLSHSLIGMATILNVGQYNTTDNLPTKAYEYMAMGLPVVLTNSFYNNEVIEKYRFGVCVDSFDERDIANSITMLLGNSEKIAQMGRSGRIAIAKEFNWNIEADKLLDLYRRVNN